MIVVTGAAGFIGSVLAARLTALGRGPLLLVDRDTEKSLNLQPLSSVEILGPEKFLAALEAGTLRGIQAILHQGACSSTTEMDIDYLRRNNTEYTQRLAEWCLKNGVYFSYASSAATYGAGELGYSDRDDLTPKLKPLNPYGRSKLALDVWAVQAGHQNQITGFRYFNVYGPNEYHKGSMRSVAHKGFEQIRDTGTLKLFKSYRPDYPDGGQKRDFVYVKDVADAVIWFLDHPEKKGIYNLGAGRAETWNEMARSLFAAMNRPLRVEYTQMPENLKDQYQYFTEADLSKLRKAGCPTRFRPLSEGVSDYVKSFLNTPNRFLGPHSPW